MGQPSTAKWKAFIAPTLAVVIIAAGLFVVPNLVSKTDEAPAANPAPSATRPAPAPSVPSEPAPTPTKTPAPSSTPTAAPLPSLVEALREAYPGIQFFEGEWGEFVPTTDDLVGQPGRYAAVPGITASYDAAKRVEFEGGTAVVTPGRIWAFSGDAATELLIEVR